MQLAALCGQNKLFTTRLILSTLVFGATFGQMSTPPFTLQPELSLALRVKRNSSGTSSVTPKNATVPELENQIDIPLPRDKSGAFVNPETSRTRELKQLASEKGSGSKLHGVPSMAAHTDFSGIPGRHSATLHRNLPQSDTCYRRAKCETLLDNSCFGVELPYSQTSIEFVNDSASQLEIQERLNLWQGLQQIPRCWAVVQPLLCAYYRPRCQDDGVALPSQEMCRLARGFCKITAVGPDWPPFLRCEESLFPSGCKNEVREIKFNTTGRCAAPLVATPTESNWYPEVEGCGLGCRHSLLNDDEHHSMRTFVLTVACVAAVACLFAVLTFMIGWKEANRYPNVMVFYINLCLLFVCIGWLAQFLPGAREDITCRRDGTLRNGEPNSGENLSCVVIFILVYYFLMGALCWLVMLAYAWDHRFESHGGPQREALDAKSAYFHLIAWCVPFVLTISVMALSKVDGDNVTGICFVSSDSLLMRSVFVLCPVTIAFFVGGYFLSSELYKLVTLKVSNGSMLNDRVRAKIQRMIVRIGAFLVLTVLLVSCTFVCHVYEFRNIPVWRQSLRDYIVCRANVLAARAAIPESSPHCDITARPSLAMLQLHLVAFLGTCVGLSSWILTPATGSVWKRFWCRTILRRPSEEPVKMQRHKLIAEAFAHRNELNRAQGSMSLRSTHEDPVGMNLDLNSVTSQDLSSTWAAALPGFLQRRGAVAGPNALPVRRYSSASDVSRQLSMSMRRQSLDSQMSYQFAEQQWLAAQRAIARSQRRKTRRERERLLVAQRPSPFPVLFRRGSDSSIQSSALHRPTRYSTVPKAAVAKATSTGDLNPGSVLSQHPSFRPRVPVLSSQQNGALFNPPFTHGMSDQNANKLYVHGTSASAANAPVANADVPQTSAINSGTAAADERAARNVSRVVPPYATLPNPYAAYVGMPYGYPPFYAGFPFYPPGIYPFGQAFASYPDLDPRHTPLIPLHPMPDSASEAGFIPIVTSDSEYTDAGIRSHDEAQLEAARRIVEERTKMVAQPGSRPQTNQETQTEQAIIESPLPRADPKSLVKSPIEEIEMREVGTGQSRLSNVSASKARMSKSPQRQAPRTSKVSSPVPSAACCPLGEVQNALQHQAQGLPQIVSQNPPLLCHGGNPYCGSQSDNANCKQGHIGNPESANHWQQQSCGCPCSVHGHEAPYLPPSSQNVSEAAYVQRNCYTQGQPLLNQCYDCSDLSLGSTGPNTVDSVSCPSNSDGVQSCHTYMFGPAPASTEARTMSNGFFLPFSGHPVQHWSVRPVEPNDRTHVGSYSNVANTASSSPNCCDGNASSSGQTCPGRPLNAADITGFVSR